MFDHLCLYYHHDIAHVFKILFMILPCQWGLEYTNSILCRGVGPSKRFVLGMKLNCIWWWDFCSGDLASMEHPFIIPLLPLLPCSLWPKVVVLLGRYLSVKWIWLKIVFNKTVCKNKQKLLINISMIVNFTSLLKSTVF